MPRRRQSASRFPTSAQFGLPAIRAAEQAAAASMPDLGSKKSPSPWRLALGFALLFIVAVPWYWRGGSGESPLVLGLPLWVAVSTGVAFLIACLAAWTAFRAWPRAVSYRHLTLATKG